MRKRNKTIIKADRIEHVDVAKIHNPRTRRNPRRGSRSSYGSTEVQSWLKRVTTTRGKLDLYKDGIDGKEIGYGHVPGGSFSFQYALGTVEPGGEIGVFRRRAAERGTYGGWRWETYPNKIIPIAPTSTSGTKNLNRRRALKNAAGKADILQQGVKAGLLPAGLVTDLQRLEEGRFPADPARRANLLQRATKLRNDLVYQNLLEENLLGEAVQRALFDVIAREQRRRSRRNPAEKDAEHPIEVTRHYRGGPPGYLSPWQKAMAIGQQELFETGIKLAPRAAELRARLSNPGATKPVYQSGLKQATAGQLPRLARVGLRVGRTPAEIRSDLATTGRFSAEQIRRAIDQATTAERRSNPTKRGRRDPREYDGPSYKFLVIEMVDPNKPWGGVDWFRLNDADRIKRNLLSMQRSGIYPPGPRRFEIFDTRNGGWWRTGQYITIDPITYQAIPEEENPRKRGRKNPPVGEIFEKFNGRPATRATSVEAPRRTPGRVAQLGRLRLIRTADGRTWRFPGERAPFLAADARGKLHVVGGQYRANPAGEECGEIEQIEYQTSKPHLGHDNETIYYHQLGEETGERPLLEITPEGELQIVGGDYRIEADGIHN